MISPSTSPVSLSFPAILGLILCLATISCQVVVALMLSQPLLGETVRVDSGLSLGTLLTGVLALAYWGRDWLSSPLKAGAAGLLGALMALLILSTPHIMITSAEQVQGSETMTMQNVVLVGGPAAWNGTTLVGNAIVRSPASTEQSSSGKGEGLVTTSSNSNQGGRIFWLALLAAPLLSIAYQRWHIRRNNTPTPP